MTRDEWIKQATNLAMDINPIEIKSHDTDESLKEWCISWQTAMNTLIVQASLEQEKLEKETLKDIRTEIENVKNNPLFDRISNDVIHEIVLEIIDRYLEDEVDE